MCRMTDTGFRWQERIGVGPFPATWYVYERTEGELRYSRKNEPSFAPLYAIRVTPKTLEPNPFVGGYAP